MGRIGDKRPEESGRPAILLEYRFPGDRRPTIQAFQDDVFLGDVRPEPIPEDYRIQKIRHPYPGPGHLVGIAGADAASGGTDFPLRPPRLGAGLDRLVIGHDDVGPVGKQKVPPHSDAAPAQVADFRNQGERVHDDTVADDVHRAAVENPRREKVEDELPVPGDNGVPGIGAALVADDNVGPSGEKVHDAGLPLIPPLGADHATVHGSHL